MTVCYFGIWGYICRGGFEREGCLYDFSIDD